MADPFSSRSTLDAGGERYEIFRLDALQERYDVARLPYTLRILLENVLRTGDDAGVEAIATWDAKAEPSKEIAFTPARALLQDFTGVPAIVDLAAMRDAMRDLGGDPAKIDPLLPSDLVIDHSVQVDAFASRIAFSRNVELEVERNRERYAFLKWGQSAFDNLKVVPPGTGICHQVNLEYLARVVESRDGQAFPDTLVGTDSHTTMVNGLGVLGWGVGGIEAEAAMLGEPLSMLVPQVVGFRLTGRLPEGSTATDLVLTVTQILRRTGVVGKLVEYFGEGLDRLPIADRATIGNMSPEYGATVGFFPVDDETLRYLRMTGRDEHRLALVEAYCKENMLWHDPSEEPTYSEVFELDHGSVVIAAITSCTNTSNPSVMIGAGLLAKKAVERGLERKPWVKSSLAPGSKVVTEYYDQAGLTRYLEELGFHTVGYGCTTCIGNSGPLPEPISKAVLENDLVVCSVLSGNRNFEARIHPEVKANYLASPPLVLAYALAGRMDVDLEDEPLGQDSDGNDVYLRDLWPSAEEIADTIADAIRSDMFSRTYADVFSGDENWTELDVPEGDLFEWDPESTYVRLPPYFEGMSREPQPVEDFAGARCLVMVGDSVTTDHISPAGAIRPDSPAGTYLVEHGVERKDFNSYGSRRGNHEVMVRGTFENVCLRNMLVPGSEGTWTVHLGSGEEMTVFEASQRYLAEGVPLVVLAGKGYRPGSSRRLGGDGAAPRR